MARYFDCQQVKVECKHPSGLLQHIAIPEWKWEVISMEFIIGLPRKVKKHDSIMVVVDKLSKVFEILERIGPVEYRLALPPIVKFHDVFHISLLKKYINDVDHVIDWSLLQVEQEGEFQLEPQCILQRKYLMLRNRAIDQVKVQWKHFGPEEAT
eukprot:PITA_20876